MESQIFFLKSKPHFSSESTLSFKSNAAYLMRPLLDFSYYTCLSPYRVQFHSGGLPCTLRTNRVQQILCAFFHLQVLILFVDYIFTPRPRKRIRDDPSQLFNLASAYIFYPAQYGFIYWTWMRRKQWLNYCTAISQLKPNQSQTRTQRKCFWAVSPILACYLVFGFATVLFVISKNLEDYPFHKFYLELSPCRIIKILEISPINNLWIEQILSIAFLINTLLLGFVLNGIVFHVNVVSSVVAYKIACDVQDYLTRDRASLQIHHVVKCFHQVRACFNEMNNAGSGPILMSVLSFIVYFSKSLTVMLDSVSSAEGLSVAGYFGGCIFSLILAGEAANKLLLFGPVIVRLRRRWDYKDPEDSASPTLFEVYSNPLGVKAHIFLITNGAIVTIISTVLTYSVVLLQFTSASPSISQLQNATQS